MQTKATISFSWRICRSEGLRDIKGYVGGNLQDAQAADVINNLALAVDWKGSKLTPKGASCYAAVPHKT
jgi:hypothetical protein